MTDRPSKDPLHGITLEALLRVLVDRLGWEGLARALPVRCFTYEPSLKSSLTFLRKTPWARKKVEALYLDLRSEITLDKVGKEDNLAE